MRRVTVLSCPKCGAEASGNFCSECGTPLGTEKRHCPECGAGLKPGALFCSDCGHPVAPKQEKPASARLPWVLSFLGLAVFALAIALFVQGRTQPRIGDAPMTGGLPEVQREEAATSGAMPSAAELAAMSPRDAADRLFDRAMSELEAENVEQAGFFANMALQAYARVPVTEFDQDASFHVGLLHLALGQSETARQMADAMLSADEDHLLALLLARRAAAALGDEEAAEEFARRFREAIAAGEQERLPEYSQHRGLIEQEAEL